MTNSLKRITTVIDIGEAKVLAFIRDEDLNTIKVYECPSECNLRRLVRAFDTLGARWFRLTSLPVDMYIVKRDT